MWNYDEIETDENHLERYEFKQHREENVNIKDEQNTRYTFNVKDVNDYINFSDGRIELECSITKSDGASIETGNVAFVNTGNLFSRAELYIGGSLVEEVEMPCLAQHILGLANFSNDYVTGSEATNMLYYKDTAAEANRNYLHFAGTAADIT